MNILNFFKGILIGAGAILPGISSGVLCVIFGMYDILIYSIINFFKDWKKHFIFLFPIIAGIGIGIIIFSNVLIFLFNKFVLQTNFIFMGLILGSISILLKKANKENFELKNVFFFFISFTISILLIFLEQKNYIYNISNNTNISFLTLILSGFCMSVGVVVPGISSTVILMLFGIYNIYLNSIATLNLAILVPMGIGLIIGSVLFLKIINICFEKFNSQTYYTIIGFACSSIFILYSPIQFNTSSLILILYFALGFAISTLLGSKK